MEKLEQLSRQDSSDRLEIDISKLESIKNENVRRVAITAREDKRRIGKDSSYKLHGTYTEAYSGERA